MNKPKYEIGDYASRTLTDREQDDVEVIGRCEHCEKLIDVPHPSDERSCTYAYGLMTVYGVCEDCEFFDNHDGFFDFYSNSDE